MSAIYGILYTDGRPADSADLQRMGAALAHRGPDTEATWCAGPVGLGHRLLQTTPESLHERQPLVRGAGDLVLVADARLDNRDEVRRALGTAGPQPTDADLLLDAYEAWGEECVRRLEGDFAFVVWDGRRHTLFCARDYLGCRPLYYHRADGAFRFASEIKALLALPEVPRRLNEARVADYLVPLFRDRSATFYRDLFSLPPGHTLTVGPDGPRLRRYWSLESVPELPDRPDAGYAEEFRRLFTEAVRARLRTVGPAASTLSGGLDSSAVVCTARNLMDRAGAGPLHTLSARFDEVPECDEREYIDLVLARGGFEPHAVHADRLSPLAETQEILHYQDEPFFLPDQYIHRAIYRTAAEHGVRVVLDGVDGDAAVSHGLPYLSHLLRTGRWLTLARETQALARSSQTPAWQLFRRNALGPFIPEAAWQARRLLTGRGGPVWGYDAAIRDDFARRTGLYHRVRVMRRDEARPAATVREGHRRQFQSGLPSLMVEVIDRAAAAFSVEARHPFFDRRLVEFCFALPPRQRFRDGYTRTVVREAMAGTLPEEIRRRNSKTDRNVNLIRALQTIDRACLDDLFLTDPAVLEPFVDVSRLQKAYLRFLSRPGIEELLTVWKTATLALWLRQSGVTA